MSGGSGATVSIIDEAGLPVEATEHGEIKTSTVSLIMYDQVEGSTLNTNIWTPSTSGMTISQSATFLNLNSGNATTAGAYALITSAKNVPFYGEQEVELSCSIMVDQLPDANEVIEFGFMAATANNAPTDGAGFIRITGGQAYGVMSFGGVETVSPPLFAVVPGVVHDMDIGTDSFNCEFEVDGNKTILNVPGSLPFPSSLARSAIIYRVYNKGTPPVHGCTLSIGRMEVVQAIITVGKPWPELLCEMARSSYQSPVAPFAATSNRGNSTAPATAALSNTTPSYSSPDGQFKFAAVAAAETNYALFGYQVPAGYQLKVSEIDISTLIEGAAIATPTTLEWSVGVNSTGASLATADGTGTVAPRRKSLGLQSFLALAGIGTQPADVIRRFNPPLIVDSGRYLHIILRVPDGAATASLVFRGTVTVNGFFE